MITMLRGILSWGVEFVLYIIAAAKRCDGDYILARIYRVDIVRAYLKTGLSEW